MSTEVSIEIDAPREDVWAVVSRPDQFATWPSSVLTVTGADGGARVGQKIKLESEANPGKKFGLNVKVVDAPSRLVFSSGMPFGLFTGTRTYAIDDLGGGRSRFTMREDYTGPMAGMISKSIPDLQPSFDKFASGLKAKVESGAAS